MVKSNPHRVAVWSQQDAHEVTEHYRRYFRAIVEAVPSNVEGEYRVVITLTPEIYEILNESINKENI